jgi:hypothetical protein
LKIDIVADMKIDIVADKIPAHAAGYAVARKTNDVMASSYRREVQKGLQMLHFQAIQHALLACSSTSFLFQGNVAPCCFPHFWSRPL